MHPSSCRESCVDRKGNSAGLTLLTISLFAFASSATFAVKVGLSADG
jgi:hypothetical protein